MDLFPHKRLKLKNKNLLDAKWEVQITPDWVFKTMTSTHAGGFNEQILASIFVF